MTERINKFLTKFAGTQIAKRSWVLLADLVFNDEKRGPITARMGFTTDLASINALRYIAPLVFALLVGYGNAACTIHDYLYQNGMYSRKECDQILFRALRGEGVARWRAWLFYAGVRMFGEKFYQKGDNDDGAMSQLVG